MQVHTWRKRYVEAHLGDFTARTTAEYYRDWVANYEISDWMNQERDQGVNFLRNVDRTDLKHEEAVRLVDEVPFQHLKKFVHSSSGALLTPSAFLSQDVANPVFIVDCQDTCGHFVLALPLLLTEDADDTPATPVTLVLNTLPGSYTTRLCRLWIAWSTATPMSSAIPGFFGLRPVQRAVS
eukprot:CAMPEP_0175920408 /NCGR_PEP_ID=MMETSP0108-20121206/12911_1 /TAXON_ID=195067 ORGANISM="Goniomonas pacifica, Strain CCMP1869" /NCGR_SAMPLE_ID=MMETSP0108 /ASSEMBLY_ACC=CAM_ASM_000204 /LENGTH=180 /DNA_ID=CAMNT_0017243119 /DNA_START=52 /DNA_END=591 /DNA_ORIENTATION=+